MKKFTSIAATVLFSAQLVNATGFEKDSLWSGEHGGKAGAAVSSAHGPEALYFNPSRLGKTQSRQILSLNFSPTWAQFTSPMGSPEASYDSKVTLSPVFGLSYGHKFNDRWAVGLGSHVMGGTNIEYNNVSFGNYTEGHYKTYLSIVEMALGGSYQITPALSAGLAWRGTITTIDYHTVARQDLTGLGLGWVSFQTDFSDMKGNDYSGLRFGLSYEPSEEWGLGLTYRSEVAMDLTGELRQTAFVEASGNQPPSAAAPLDQPAIDGDAKIKTTLPQSIVLGGHFKFGDNWKLFGEYSWVEYSKVEKFDIEATGYQPIADLDLKWKDQNIIRIAGEYRGWFLPLRLGYSYSTAVTHKSYASPNYLGPAAGHLVSVGSGYSLIEGLQIDGAVEYYFDSATVSASDSLNPAQPGVGEYKTTVLPTIHLGMTYNF